MDVLPGVLGCRTLRRTIQVRLGTDTLRLPGGTPSGAKKGVHPEQRFAGQRIGYIDEDEQDGGAKVWGKVQVLDVSSCFFC